MFTANLIGKEKKMQKYMRTLQVAAIILFCSACNFASNQLQPRYQNQGVGMLPTFPDDSIVIVDENAYEEATPQRGDVIIFQHPRNADVTLVKRVIGLPFEQIEVKDEKVYVNGESLAETYIGEAPLYTGDWSIGEGEYFVLGDNRNSSSDSHTWGMLTEGLIIGKVTRMCETDSAEKCTEIGDIVYNSTE